MYRIPMRDRIDNMTPKQSEFQPVKEEEYELFLIWRTMSRPMKELGIPYLDQLGINDEKIRELAGIRNQNEFAAKYNLSIDTLTDWKKHPVPERYADIHPKKWLKETVPEIYRLLFTGFNERKDPATGKLLLEASDEYIQKSEIKVDGTQELFEGLKKIAERLED
jgi:hypothetical protein